MLSKRGQKGSWEKVLERVSTWTTKPMIVLGIRFFIADAMDLRHWQEQWGNTIILVNVVTHITEIYVPGEQKESFTYTLDLHNTYEGGTLNALGCRFTRRSILRRTDDLVKTFSRVATNDMTSTNTASRIKFIHYHFTA